MDKSVGQRALGPDQTISGKVQTTIDAAAQHARAVDEKQGYTKYANDVSTHVPSSQASCLISMKYYSSAITSSLGQKVRAFYTSTSKQVRDIHEEALRIANEQKLKAGNSATPDATQVSESIELKVDTVAPSK